MQGTTKSVGKRPEDHAVAVAGQSTGRKPRSYFDIQGEREALAKRAVAEHIVAKYFHPGDSILLDAGTSLYPIASRILELSVDRPDETHFVTVQAPAFAGHFAGQTLRSMSI